MPRFQILVPIVFFVVALIVIFLMFNAAFDNLDRDLVKDRANCVSKYPQTYRIVNGVARLRTDSGILPADPCNVLRSYTW